MESELNASEEDKEVVTKTKKKIKKKTKMSRLPKDMITNERGEIVTLKEYTLGKTYNDNDVSHANYRQTRFDHKVAQKLSREAY
jgi:predicted small metal-binding protein